LNEPSSQIHSVGFEGFPVDIARLLHVLTWSAQRKRYAQRCDDKGGLEDHVVGLLALVKNIVRLLGGQHGADGQRNLYLKLRLCLDQLRA
jgi:hypothetical protein